MPGTADWHRLVPRIYTEFQQLSNERQQQSNVYHQQRFYRFFTEENTYGQLANEKMLNINCHHGNEN